MYIVISNMKKKYITINLKKKRLILFMKSVKNWCGVWLGRSCIYNALVLHYTAWTNICKYQYFTSVWFFAYWYSNCNNNYMDKNPKTSELEKKLRLKMSTEMMTVCNDFVYSLDS